MDYRVFRRLVRFNHWLASSEGLRRNLHRVGINKVLGAMRDIALLVLAILAIYIAYRDYLKTDVRLEITAPIAGSVVLKREISIEGAVSGGPYNGYEVHHKAPGNEHGRLVQAVQESGEQMTSPVFPVSLSLADENGAPQIGQHTVMVTLKSGSRNVQVDSVAFDVIDCSLVVPPALTAGRPIHDLVDLRTDEEIQGYEFLFWVDGARWTLDCLDPIYLEDGYHELRIAAVVRGSEEEADSVTTNFVVDNTPPIVDSLGLSDGAKVNSRSVFVPTIFDPHLVRLELCVDNVLIGELEGKAFEQRLASGDLGFTLEGGWQHDMNAEAAAPVLREGREDRRLEDGWHDELIKACDINGLCSAKSVKVWVDNTCPELWWDLPSGPAIPVLPSDGFWLGAKTSDSEAVISYYVEAPAAVVKGEFLDTSECELGSEHTVSATAVDQAGNAETQVARLVVERSPQAWLNTGLRAVSHGVSFAMGPVSDLLDQLASEGLAIGIGAEVSSSLADESKLMWRGIFDFDFVEICPMLSQGFNENMTVGLGFRVPLECPGLTPPGLTTSLICPVLDFGAAVTPNWQVLDSLDFGTEIIAETWVKLSLSTLITIPLSAQGDAMLKIDVGPGCKLSYVQDFVREPVYVDGEIVEMRRFTQDSVKLEVTIDGSISFSSRQR
jgi:hypothetical protein